MRLFLFIALLAVPAHAHDFWIEPSTFRPDARVTFTTSLRVGEHFEGDPVPRRAKRIESFVVRTASGEQSVNGLENQDPAGFVRIDEAGTAVIGYRGAPYPHEISRAKFEQFLREEGVVGITPTSAATQKEHFQRFAKSIVQIGSVTHEIAPLGFRFELVLEGDGVRVLYEGRPLANMQVAALSRDGKQMTARSDANGVARFAFTKGVWLVKAVHVLPKGNEWESLWASLTFQLPSF
jgi:uncharacterized GH25 family protein